MRSIYLIILIVFLLPACTPKFDISNFSNKEQDKLANTQSLDPTLNDIMKADRLLAVKNANTLYLVDPQYPKPYALYGFDASEKPINGNLDTFLLSPSKQWIAWYSPLRGVVALNIKTLKTKVIQPADDFLNTYPYLEFFPDQDTLLCIINKGNTFLQTDLNSFGQQKIEIPYPYGNVFKISPDKTRIVFVSGFGQSKNPKFLITDVSGKLIQQFSASINMTDRHLVFWSPDSNGLFLINEDTLQLYTINDPENPQNYYQFDNTQISTATMVDQSIYLLTTDGYWHMIDTNTKKETARAPLEIASELQQPKFYPWKDKQFLIEETVNENPGTYNRLWLSDFRGVKKMVMDKYNDKILQTFPDKID